jgi:hypothetical protein
LLALLVRAIGVNRIIRAIKVARYVKVVGVTRISTVLWALLGLLRVI